ncbi:hypothetical protein PR202_gb17621 [Eleusine coracana subsp. coracana]|uniref:Pentatricopeptide repeat-containing protein n=1 Tax=Eleusine coracana subsp. coracana TaxID=191504 RepID=A0AAV5F3G1_ELECO|nr:hypothetical protein PR202_gb17621 [Eleusine coracana subsp. coracana]
MSTPWSQRHPGVASSTAEGADEAELVCSLLRRTGGGKERLMVVLDPHVRVVRTEHCFLFEELGRRDAWAWLQCLEIGCWIVDTAIQKGFILSGSTYKLLYKVYTKANNTDLVQQLLKRMNKQGIVPNKKFFLDAWEASGNSERKPRTLPSANSAGELSTDSVANSETATWSQPKLSISQAAVR